MANFVQHRIGKGKRLSGKPMRCRGCGILCAGAPSLADHEYFCAAVQDEYKQRRDNPEYTTFNTRRHTL